MNSIKWWKTAALAVSLTLFASLAYWFEFRHRPEQEAREENSKKLFPLKDIQIQEMALIDESGKTFKFKCASTGEKNCKPGDHSDWQILAPVSLEGDKSNVNSLLSSLNNLISKETIQLDKETPEKRTALLKEYGLDAESRKSTSRKKVMVTTSAGENRVAYLGEKHPIGGDIFALSEINGEANENQVYLIPAYFTSNFDHNLTYWRNKKLLSWASHKISSFDLESQANGGRKFSAEKREGKWFLKSGSKEFAADSEGIDTMLSAATFLTAKDFIGENQNSSEAKRALRGSKKTITLTLYQPGEASPEETLADGEKASKAPQKVTIEFFEKGGRSKNNQDKKNEKLYASLSSNDLLYELQTTEEDKFNKSLKGLRLAKLVTSLERFSVKRLEFFGSNTETPVILKKEESGWIVSEETKTPQKPIDSDKVRRLLDKLSGKQIKDFLTETKSLTRADENIQMILGEKQTPERREFLFWKKDNHLYGKDLLASNGEIYQLDSSMVKLLPWNPDHFAKNEAPPTEPKK